jgi:DNA-binding response OmpR family regulator
MSGQNTILIVDDDQTIAHSMAAGLNAKGYATQVEYDGAEGLIRALALHPALILLDYNLPDLDGVAYLERLRQDEWGKTVPVVVASNIYEVDIINAIMALGVQDYVLKVDVNLDEIVELVGKYVPPRADDTAAA